MTVTDVDTEAPGKPGTPTVSAGSATSLRVNWSAPSNAGPPITGYDVRHRISSPEGSWTEKNVPSIAAVIESLTENTSYDVQVRATNAEGTGAWSDSGSGTTDAAAALPTLSVADAEGDEDDGVEFTATLTTAVSAKVTATWTASIESGDTASAADLAATKTGEVEFDADAMTAKFTVPVTDDTTDEENETFTVTLSSPSSNAQLATDPTAKGTIRDDDPPVLSFKQASYTAAEGGSAVEVELMLTSALPGNFFVTITAEHGAGATAEDYTGISDGARAIFTAGQTRSVFEVTAFDDAFDEDDETVTFGFTIPSSADVTKGSVSEATLTLTDNDDPPTLSVADVSGAEGTALTFTVTLSDESGKTVTVDYATSAETGDTATSGTDFTAKTSTTLTFDPGQEEKTFTVQTTDDTDIEEDETFTVTLSNPSNATISDATAKGTINDDDATDDCSADTTTTCEVDVGGSATGDIETVNDRDWFARRARGGHAIPDRCGGRGYRPRHPSGPERNSPGCDGIERNCGYRECG